MSTSVKAFLIILAVLILDQWLKVHIKLNYEYGEEHLLFGLDWARLKFVENPGMAFGMELGGEYGKMFLSVFRICLAAGLVWYMGALIKHKVSDTFIYCIAFIAAGAIGNIIDSAVYGLIFTESPYHGGLAEYDPSNGYASFLHGRVVDMFYFPIKYFDMPEWLPLIGGENFLFFSPIFNIADASITTGLLSILLFQNHFFSAPPALPEEPEMSDSPEDENLENTDSGFGETDDSSEENSPPDNDYDEEKS